MVTCGNCGAVLFIDMDGNLQFQESEVSQPAGPSLDTGEPVFDSIPVELAPEPILDLPSEPVADQVQDFKPVEEFGNSETVGLPLSYTLRIEGIDTRDLVDAVGEVLSDPKLKLDHKALMKQASSGTLVIERVNAIKAMVILQKLKGYSLTLSWDQHAFEN
ncbi:MAG: hypothetical protein LW875_06770 [Proteobacteria bacterium]|jgi:hypothetical protein|nr:hypothetical protein [Pseudomonadota bacterium]